MVSTLWRRRRLLLLLLLRWGSTRRRVGRGGRAGGGGRVGERRSLQLLLLFRLNGLPVFPVVGFAFISSFFGRSLAGGRARRRRRRSSLFHRQKFRERGRGGGPVERESDGPLKSRLMRKPANQLLLEICTNEKFVNSINMDAPLEKQPRVPLKDNHVAW